MGKIKEWSCVGQIWTEYIVFLHFGKNQVCVSSKLSFDLFLLLLCFGSDGGDAAFSKSPSLTPVKRRRQRCVCRRRGGATGSAGGSCSGGTLPSSYRGDGGIFAAVGFWQLWRFKLHGEVTGRGAATVERTGVWPGFRQWAVGTWLDSGGWKTQELFSGHQVAFYWAALFLYDC